MCGSCDEAGLKAITGGLFADRTRNGSPWSLLVQRVRGM
jgi:hypothetical protein